jgi:putative PIG3 family NAD(P)H quinone oxidoreductase
MQAIIISRPGGPEVLELSTVETPKPQRGEVLVRIIATAINRADVMQREGKYPPPPDASQNIPGLEFAGEVAEVGEFAGWNVGDRVFGLTSGGSYAQYTAVHGRTLSRIPEHLDYEQAAALPEACITAYDAMITQGKLSAGEYLLINGITSGVGTIALQIANAIGAQVIGTSRSAAKIPRIEELGSLQTIITADGKFSEKVMSASKGNGVDVVLELIGGNYVQEDILCTKIKGRIIVVGLLAGRKTEVSLATILSKRLHIIGTTLRARPLEEKIQAALLFQTHVVPLICGGKIKPVIDKVFELTEAAEAHRFMGSNDSFGKIVLKIRL